MLTFEVERRPPDCFQPSHAEEAESDDQDKQQREPDEQRRQRRSDVVFGTRNALFFDAAAIERAASDRLVFFLLLYACRCGTQRPLVTSQTKDFASARNSGRRRLIPQGRFTRTTVHVAIQDVALLRNEAGVFDQAAQRRFVGPKMRACRRDDVLFDHH